MLLEVNLDVCDVLALCYNIVYSRNFKTI